ncbi:MAG: hypothetical protein NVSMB17_17220 [Candidatus Dormibacteria bacterium]
MLAVLALVPAPAARADGALPALVSERASLQAKVGQLSADQASALQNLMTAHDRLADLRRQLTRNQGQLADVRARHESLVEKVAEAHARIDSERRSLGLVARETYKSRAQLSAAQVLFGSSNLSQVLNRVTANRAITDRAHALAGDLRAVEADLTRQASELARREQEMARLQRDLVAQKASIQATASEYQGRLDSLSASSTELLRRISSLNTEIAAANRPPPAGVTPGQKDVVAIIRAAAARHGASADQMVSVARCESSLNPRAYDPGSGASGLFQFMPGTFYGRGGHDIWDAADQSEVAARMFAAGQAGQWSCR